MYYVKGNENKIIFDKNNIKNLKEIKKITLKSVAYNYYDLS